jgi:6-phosphofructokinase 1
MIDLLLNDKENNPSNYCIVILSEGAEWEGYQVVEYGETDMYGHRKKMSVGEAFGQHIHQKGEETVISDLTYDLRSGEADFIDKMVATTFANMALDAIQHGEHGKMAAIQDGCYRMVEIPTPGARKVDVATMYNTRRYRPRYDNKVGLPLFMTKA